MPKGFEPGVYLSNMLKCFISKFEYYDGYFCIIYNTKPRIKKAFTKFKKHFFKWTEQEKILIDI